LGGLLPATVGIAVPDWLALDHVALGWHGVPAPVSGWLALRAGLMFLVFHGNRQGND
jgi:hypothetical protein